MTEQMISETFQKQFMELEDGLDEQDERKSFKTNLGAKESTVRL